MSSSSMSAAACRTTFRFCAPRGWASSLRSPWARRTFTCCRAALAGVWSNTVWPDFFTSRQRELTVRSTGSVANGPWALIFGRHIPGFRVPLTVVAGILELPYRVFAISVAVSSAAWAGVFLVLGSVFGSSIEKSIRANVLLFAEATVVIIAVVAVVALVRSLRHARQA